MPHFDSSEPKQKYTGQRKKGWGRGIEHKNGGNCDYVIKFLKYLITHLLEEKTNMDTKK